MRFAAATETALLSSYNRSERGGARGGVADETEEELRAVVGRMLWEEMWGGYCVDVAGRGGRAMRWWEDEEIMEECVRMGTTWEFLFVEAVKEG